MKKISKENQFDQLIYVRLTEACNMRCDHCFIPANPKKMQAEDCRKIPEIIEKVSQAGDRVILQWHGGEPTLYGAKRFKQILDDIAKSVKDREIVHGIQTNLANYNNDWAEIYHKYFNSRIGVSWDYSIRHLRDNSADFNQYFKGQVEKLNSDGISFDLTITAAAPFYNWVITQTPEFFLMLEELRPRSLHIEKLTKTGMAKLNWPEIGVNNLQYSQLLSLIYAYSITWITPNQDWFDGISPLSDIEHDIQSLINGSPLELRGCTSGVCDTKFHTIDANGYKFGCTAINSEVDNSAAIGIVEMITPEDLRQIRAERVVDCKDCHFKTICNTGCIASTKVDSSGECNGAFTLRQNILKLIRN